MSDTGARRRSDARDDEPARRRGWGRTVAGLAALVVLGAPLVTTAPVEPVPHFDAHRPANIAHAGAQGHVPPNTIEAFEAAVALGADTLEMDLQLTADDVVVVHHDGTVDRQTDGTGAIRDMTLAELRDLDAGYAFTDADGGHPFRGQGLGIPTLEEVLEAFPTEFMVLEMKTESGQEIVAELAELVRAYDREDDVVVASFDLAFIEEFREHLPDVPTTMPEDEARDFHVLQALGLHRWWQPPGELLQVPEYHDGIHVTSHRFFTAAAELGIDTHVWTINDPDEMRRHLAAGADGLITDYPDRMVDVVAERRAGAPLPGVDRGDVALTEWLQARGPWLEAPVRGVSVVGGEAVLVLGLPLVYWAVSRRVGLRLGVAVAASAGLAEVAKLATHTPRPVFLDPSLDAGGTLAPGSGPGGGTGVLGSGRVASSLAAGLPSAVAQNGVVLAGGAAEAVRRRWAWALAAAVVALLVVARVHAGAAYPRDVLAGLATGAVVLYAYLRLRGPVERWLAARGPRAQVGLALAASAALVVLAAIARVAFLGWQPPATWVGVSPDAWPIAVSRVVGPAGALFGLAAGAVLARRRGGFAVDGPWQPRVLRCVVGVAGVVLLWWGLAAVFPAGEDPVALAYRWLRYAFVGAWVTGLAPLWFRRLGLAGSERARATVG